MAEVKRFYFTIKHDLDLLRTAVNANPWQLGNEKWRDVCDSLTRKFKYELKPRTAKDSRKSQNDVENKRLHLEIMRETRLAEEGKRWDELMLTTCAILSSFTNKND
jgi:hypothetical protein